MIPRKGRKSKKSSLRSVSVMPLMARRCSTRRPPQYVALGKTRYKWLDGGVHFIDAVPKNPSGKILVSALLVHSESMFLISSLECRDGCFGRSSRRKDWWGQGVKHGETRAPMAPSCRFSVSIFCLSFHLVSSSLSLENAINLEPRTAGDRLVIACCMEYA